jgi:hypothetical protein
MHWSASVDFMNQNPYTCTHTHKHIHMHMHMNIHTQDISLLILPLSTMKGAVFAMHWSASVDFMNQNVDQHLVSTSQTLITWAYWTLGVYIHIHIYMYVYMYMCVCVCMGKCRSTSSFDVSDTHYVGILDSRCVYACMCMDAYVFVCVCVCVCV